jgi:hypothetical protein
VLRNLGGEEGKIWSLFMKTIHVKEMVAGDIYVARAMKNIKGSVLGNPFKIGVHGNRAEVIERYRHWLWQQIKLKGEVYNELVRIVKLYRENPNIRLVCWCSPKECHADVIIKAIKWLDTQI